MNLHFHPIVLFEEAWPFPVSHLKDVVWQINAEPIGLLVFSVDISSDSPFEVQNDKNYIEFHLSKQNVLFQHDDYPCEIIFSTTLDSPHSSPVQINCSFWGVVKTVWSKGLQ